jgi:GNAT superfamily N-acetyltransferase
MHAREPIAPGELTIVPANEAPWEDLQLVLGTSEHCYCQRFKTSEWVWHVPQEVRRESLRAQTNCGEPDAATTAGLVAYLGEEPVGWVAVEPRTAYPGLTRTVWSGRSEDKGDEDIYAVTCFVVRRGYRRRGITYALAGAAVEYARERGARAIEGYPMMADPGKEIIWGEMAIGARQVFDEAGFTEVSHPSKRRYVMRIDFDR